MGNKLNSQRLSESHLVSHRSAIKTSCSQKNDLLPSTEDYQAQFYEVYRKEAKEHDEGFIKMHSERLDTTLIFVSPASYQIHMY